MTAPGSAHLAVLSPCHTLVCQLFLWLQFKDLLESLSGALSLHPLPEGGSRDLGWEGPKGLFPQGCKCAHVHKHMHMRARQGSERI